MKKQHSIFASLFGGRKSEEPQQQKKPRPVTISAYSQSDVLQARMKEQKMTHGETVTANLSPVRLELNYGYMTMYFCPMKNIDIIETIGEGDGGRIPPEAKVEGLNAPAQSQTRILDTLKNITLTSNGTMQVKATSDTVWEQL